jgi:predicted dehydrogenase
MPIRQTRRRFLKTSAAAAASTFAAPALLRGRNLNEKLNIAVIGCGGRGGSNLADVSSENIVALVDVNANNLAQAANKHPQARQLADFRKLFDTAKEFDAVVLPALQLGKHVYCEKPLTHSVSEARVIREAAARAKVATQMGTQIHAGDNYRRVVELVQSGAIGPVREVHVWVGRAWGWQSPEDAKAAGDIVSVQSRPAGADPVPAGLDWDLWLGPAPERPFNNVYFPGPKWYRWWDFGNGTMSDLGSHWIDLPFWALDLKAPLSIEAAGPLPHPELAPASMQVKYQYGPRIGESARPGAATLSANAVGDTVPLELTWYQGANKPALWEQKQIPQWDSGVLFIGDGGMLLSDYGKYVLLPEDKFAGFTPPAPWIPASLGHHAEWLHACKTGAPTTCNFEYAGWLTEANHLGNVAYRCGQRLEWDAEGMRATNCPEAERFVKREYRKGWKLNVVPAL